jgi:hypothetical protein
MKKKLKVKKAFLGMMAKSIRRGTPIRKKITNIFPRGPKASTIINPVRPGTVINPVRQPGMYQPGGPPRDPNMFSTTPPRPNIQFGVQPLPAAPGPLGGQVTQPAPMQQQAAPVQPIPAMKKGGMIRGQGIAIRGTKFKGIF